MAMTNSAPISQWEFDTHVWTPDTADLHGVRAASAEEVWAVGSAVTAGTRRALVGRWKPEFRFVEPPADDALNVRLSAVDLVGDDVWAVGAAGNSPRIERYSRLSAPDREAVAGPAVDGALLGVAMLSGSEGWAVGGSGRESTQTLIARWDGGTWRVVPSPSPGTVANRLEAVAARSADDVWAVGHSSDTDGRPEALVLHWDGSAWTRVPVPDALAGGTELLGVAVAGTDSVWAVGTRFADPARQTALALHWDGSAWHLVQSGQTPATQLSAAMAMSEVDVWFAGYAKLPGGPETAHIEHWDGQRMRAEASGAGSQGNVASALSGISAAAGRLVAVGWRTTTKASYRLPAAMLGRGGA